MVGPSHRQPSNQSRDGSPRSLASNRMVASAAAASSLLQVSACIGFQQASQKKKVQQGSVSLGRMQACECPVFRLYRQFHRAMVVKGASFRQESAQRGRSCWNLSFECLQDRSRAECSFGIEVRNRAGHQKTVPTSLPLLPHRGMQSEMLRDSSRSSLASNTKQGNATDWSYRGVPNSKQDNSASKWSEISMFSEPVEGSSDRISRENGANSLMNSGAELMKRAAQGVVQCATSPFSSKSLSASVCLGMVVFVVLVGLMKLKDSRSRKGQAVKNRILKSQWFNDSRLDANKRRTSTTRFTPKTPVRSSRGNKSSKFDFRSTDVPEYNHLVIHDGEVIRGGPASSVEAVDSFTKRKVSPGSILAGAEHDRPFRSESKEDTGFASTKFQSSPEPQQDAKSVSRIRDFLTRKEAPKPRSLFQRPGGFRRSFVENRAGTRSASGKQDDEKKEAASGNSGYGKVGHQRNWNDKDELDLRHRIDELRQSVQAAETNRRAAILALAEERKRTLELEVKISRQKEAAVALEEEVRVLKESHEALLSSLRKKYSSSVAARAAAALLYQNWESGTSNDSDLQNVSY